MPSIALIICYLAPLVRAVNFVALQGKPAPEKAPSNLAVVGRYIIEPGVFTNLAEGHKGAGGEIQLTDALASRIGKAAFSGLKFSGQRYDCGSKIGFIKANMAFALQRSELSAELRKWLAEQISS